MLFMELERINHADRFIDIAAKRQIVYDLMAHDAFFIDHERAAVSDGVAGQHVVAAGDGFGEVCGVRVWGGGVRRVRTSTLWPSGGA